MVNSTPAETSTLVYTSCTFFRIISKCSVLFEENIVQKRYQGGERKGLVMYLGNILCIQKTEQSIQNIWLLVWKQQMIEEAGLIDSVEEVEWNVMWDKACKWYGRNCKILQL